MSHHQDAVNRGRRKQILEAFRDAEQSVLTTTEVHEAVGGVTQETIRNDLKRMQGSELAGRETSQDFVWWVDPEAVSGTDARRGVATSRELRNAVANVVMERYDFRILVLALAFLTLNSFAGIALYLMLEFETWLLPVSVTNAILYTYAPMVAFGMVIAASGAVVLFRERA